MCKQREDFLNVNTMQFRAKLITLTQESVQSFILNALMIFYHASRYITGSAVKELTAGVWGSEHQKTCGFTLNTCDTSESCCKHKTKEQYEGAVVKFFFSIRLPSPSGHCWYAGSGEAWGWPHHSGVGGGCSAAGRHLGPPSGRSIVGGDPVQMETLNTTRAWPHN